jgi:hypothetical protein
MPSPKSNKLMLSVILRIATILSVGAFCLALPDSSRAQMSFSTDFDGRGTGRAINVGSFHSSSTGPRPSSGRPGATSESSGSAIQNFLDRRYQEQLREIERRAEEERLRQAKERAEHLNEVKTLQTILEQIQRLENDEPSVVQRMVYTQQVLDLQKQFEAARTAYLGALPGYQQRLAASLNHINVPPPVHPLHYRRILILGMSATAEEARKKAANGEQDPFEAKPFDDVFAFGTAGPTDAGRVTLDHLLGQFEHLSPQTSAQIGRLKGAEADEVVCHSNGCRVVEVLIATGMLKIHRLRMLGGDNVGLELNALKALKAKHRDLSEVSVYMIHGDPVPMIYPGWMIMDRMAKIGHPLQTFAGMDASYQLLGLTSRPCFNSHADVQVHVLSYPPPASSNHDLFYFHSYERYARVLNGWRVSGCLEPTGPMSQRCMIY